MDSERIFGTESALLDVDFRTSHIINSNSSKGILLIVRELFVQLCHTFFDYPDTFR
jgi:hypothetical protein